MNFFYHGWQKTYRHEKYTSMRVDLSPRLGGHTVANQPPHYCPPLIHLHPPGMV